MIDLKSMTLEELTAWLQEQGEPAFRGKQVFRWFYRGATSFGEMSDLSKPLRQKLEDVYKRQVRRLSPGVWKRLGSNFGRYRIMTTW